ncbi:MAG: polysaccharide deacetylase family protein [Candidatus Krumholzibacteriota bacterium]|nr:polysaccharide deacetylase family protein [Candidatus Krumholzibacteriota bacterium]
MNLLFHIELIVAYILYYSGLYWIRRKSMERKGSAVVLVYHRIAPGQAGTGKPVGEESFERQMRFLGENFIPSTWEEIVSPADPAGGIRVLVTFDDAYKEIFTIGINILEKHSIQSIFFIPTDFVFRKVYLDCGDEPESAAADPFPSPGDIEKAISSPFVRLGNHTASHAIAAKISPPEFAQELSGSQAELEEKLGKRPEYFAFPRGRRADVPSGAAEILRAEGIEAAFTMIPGLVGAGTDPYLVPRIGVSHVNNMILFRVKALGMLTPLVKLKNELQMK